MPGSYRGRGRRQFSKRKGPKQDEGLEPQSQAVDAEPSTVAAGRYRESLASLLRSANAENAQANPAVSAAANAADSAELQQAAMTMVELAATAQEAQPVTTHGNGNGNTQEGITILKTPSDFEAAFDNLVRKLKIAQHADDQPDADHDNNGNKSVSPPTEEAAATPIAEHETSKAAAGMQAQATAFQMPHPGMMDRGCGRAAVGEHVATIQASHPAMMNSISGQTAVVGEKPMVVHTPYHGMMDPTFGHADHGMMNPTFGHAAVGGQVNTIQTAHPAMMDPAFGQAAIGENPMGFHTPHPAMMNRAFGRAAVGQHHVQTSHGAMMNPAFGQAAVGEKPMVIHSSHPAMMDPAFAHAAVGKNRMGFHAPHPAMMNPDFGHAAIGEQVATIQTSHPSMVDPGFGQAARHEQQLRDDAREKTGAGPAKPVSPLPVLARPAAARRRTPDEFRQSLIDRVHSIKAAENAPEKLLGILQEFRACLDERMTEFVVINGVMFDLGCGGPYR